ncbi:hypothetical protein RhiirB3_392936 [Rhizophagus irregularis]|nr:hypothetical protein RhiirB3_392936 [Rhizophagus irregularis]
MAFFARVVYRDILLNYGSSISDLQLQTSDVNFSDFGDVRIFFCRSASLNELLTGIELSEFRTIVPVNQASQIPNRYGMTRTWDVFNRGKRVEIFCYNSDDEKQLATSTLDGQIIFWDVENGIQTGTIEGRKDISGSAFVFDYQFGYWLLGKVNIMKEMKQQDNERNVQNPLQEFSQEPFQESPQEESPQEPFQEFPEPFQEPPQGLTKNPPQKSLPKKKIILKKQKHIQYFNTWDPQYPTKVGKMKRNKKGKMKDEDKEIMKKGRCCDDFI